MKTILYWMFFTTKTAVLSVTLAFSLAFNTHAESLSEFTGDAEKGRLVFAQCRTCHYPEKIIGHHNGPNLHAIFGKVAGKQVGFDD